MFAILLGTLAGLGLPVQTSVNARLKQKVKSPFMASFISFVSAIIALICLLFICEGTVLISFEKLINEPLWIYLGGICGVTFLTGNILLLPRIGSVQTVIFPVCGQIIGGLLIDNFGFFNVDKIPLTILKLFGAALVIAGVCAVVASKKNNVEIKAKGIKLILWSLFGIFTGSLSAVQTAVNGRLSQVLSSPIEASVVSFAVGIIMLSLICIIFRPKVKMEKENRPYWMWFGGILGAIYILANIYLSPVLGTGLTVISLLTGTIAGGIIIDYFGLFETQKSPMNLNKIIGLILMFLGVFFIKFI